MWSWMMLQWQHEVFRRLRRRSGHAEEEACEALPLARAGRNGLLHRTMEWLVRQLTTWQKLPDELNRPTTVQRPPTPSTPIGEVL